eukprot:NODE_17718_length_929_cov_2.223192.p1 GENE.NODE_17718_length_929_cov_2.223192~~NODE_17718_length_929_cov_2.223192.p1  ORF type:complete len:260 (-),score=76.47 NODE_17718_length_929_cov_2.223192:150-929(-)
MMWKAAVACQSDACQFMVELAAQLKGWKAPEAWAAELVSAESAVEEENRKKALAPAMGRDALKDQALVNPIAACLAMNSVMPAEDAIIVVDGGDFVATTAYTVQPRQPLGWLDAGPFGSLGAGGGFALGAKLARPDKEVWLVWGDGACGYSVLELDTLIRHKAPVLAVVGNDACWTQIQRDQLSLFKDEVACPLEYTEYDKVAEGLGCVGFCVGRDGDCSENKVREVLEEARAVVREGTPALVNILIGKSDFREGSISV